MCKIDKARSGSMARREKGNDKVLMYSIIGFVAAIIILSVALIVSSGNDEPEYDYEDDIFANSYLSSYESFDSQSEDLYAVYVYRFDCAACKSIKQKVLSAVASNDSDLKIYLASTYDLSGDGSSIVFEGYRLQATPTMLVYRDGELVDLIEGGGSTQIPAFLNDVERGNYN